MRNPSRSRRLGRAILISWGTIQSLNISSAIRKEYQQCYPETLLTKVVSAAQEGIEGIGVKVAKPDSLLPVVGLLNAAWQEFWRAPEGYQAWEAARLDTLRASLDAIS